MTRRRLLLRLGAALLVISVALLLLGRWFLTSRFAARIAASSLQQRVGAPVSVGGIDVGLTSRIVLRDVTVCEPDGQPWLVAPEVCADVGLIDLLFGSSQPSLLQIRRGRLELRFSDQGDPLTNLPGSSDGQASAMPEVMFEDATVVLRQQGRSTLRIRGVRGRLHAVNTGEQVDAEVRDPVWGNWKGQVGWGGEGVPFTLSIRTDRVHVTPALVEGLPFLFPEVARTIKPTGDTSAQLALRLGGGLPRPYYRAAFGLDGVDVALPDYRLRATQARGSVVVEDGLATFSAVTARAARGDVAGSGTVDFSGEALRAHLTLSAQNVQLRQLPATWGIPEQLEGAFTGSAEVLVVEGSPPTITGSGTGMVTGATWGGVTATGPVRLRLRAGPEGLAWSHTLATMRWPWSLLSAWGRLPLLPLYLQVRLRLDDVPADRVVSLLRLDLPVVLRGQLSTDLEVGIPVHALTDPAQYVIRGPVQVVGATIDGEPLARAAGRLELRHGVLTVTDLQTDWGEPHGTLTGSVSARLFPRGGLVADLQGERVPVVRLAARYFPQLRQGEGTVSGNVRARVPLDRSFDPACWDVEGRLLADELRLDQSPLDWIEAAFTFCSGVMEVGELRAGWKGLQVEGTLRGELGGAGSYLAELRLKPAELELVKQLLPTGDPAVPLSGELTASATLTGTTRPFTFRVGGKGRVDRLSGGIVEAERVNFTWQADAERFEISEVTARRLAIDRVPLSQVEAQVVLDRRRLRFRAHGQLFDGNVHIDGETTSPVAQGGEAPTTVEGAVMAEGVSAQRLCQALRLTALAPLSGEMGLESSYRVALDRVSLTRWWDGIEASGRAWISRARWGRMEVSPELRAELRWEGEQLEVRELVGALAQGRLRSRGLFYLDQAGRGWFEVNLDRIEASRLLAMLDPDTASGRPGIASTPAVEGPVELRIRGAVGPTWRGTGQFVLGRGKVFGVEVHECRVPFRMTFDPQRRSGQVDVHDSSAQVARGRVVGEATVGWGLGSHLKGSLRFYHINLPLLLRPFVRLQQLGQGRMSGRLDFNGRNVRSLADLRATLDADLRQTQALEFPVLREASAFFPNVRPTTLFPQGTARATLSRGVVRLQRLSLEGPLLDLFVEGTATVPQGRLALEMTARSSSMLPDPMIVRLLGLPLIGPVPTVILVRASNYLASRVLHLHITGTMRSPNVRIEPVRLLTDEAVRFFLLRPSLPQRSLAP